MSRRLKRTGAWLVGGAAGFFFVLGSPTEAAIILGVALVVSRFQVRHWRSACVRARSTECPAAPVLTPVRAVVAYEDRSAPLRLVVTERVWNE
jgi:hypothetical protein